MPFECPLPTEEMEVCCAAHCSLLTIVTLFFCYRCTTRSLWSNKITEVAAEAFAGLTSLEYL